ncbi:MFS transporter [Falsirhodobacter xinxiangensis]|uniref:MFS transporter n=1 Tax=Falsirhodobacter xinxiangensis TaxID=2530049 RepID=UPI0010AAAB60|nr:MFS transporter [Rhodobacter xinxiangensis]
MRRIWGWYFFDWASQPYNTLLITFIFAPYMTRIIGDGAMAQSVWGLGLGLTGILIALAAPVLGTIADRAGGHMRFILLFSVLYVAGAWGLWWSAPGDFSIWWVMLSFSIGMIGMEFATTFTNALMPGLAAREDMGRLSGSGWAFGYVGGVVALIFVLLLLQEGPEGRTLLGIAPIFGLDAAAAEGTRAVGPFTAIWYAVFMIPFFLWVRVPHVRGIPVRRAARQAWPELRAHLRELPKRRSFAAFLGASMLYRDALNGIYAFGGIYAAGVLGWQVRDVGIFGILAAVTGAIFAWLGGRADSRYGSMPVIVFCTALLALLAAGVVGVSRGSVFGMAVAEGSRLPDIAFYAIGALIGAAGGALQAASRTMLLWQSDPARLTESFGLYALAGKATSFLAPLLVGIVTAISGSQRVGVVPVIVLFLLGLLLLLWVKPKGEQAP